MKTYKKAIIFAVVMCILPSIAVALKNPASVYCAGMGYELATQATSQGQIEICKFSENESCPSNDFLIGSCGSIHSYCARSGYSLKTVSNASLCSSLPAIFSQCSVCVLVNGTEVEVTKLMNLSFQEGVCGDGRCVIGENYKSCPQDCPSGQLDYYCDGLTDGRCDPDCPPTNDTDCQCGNSICSGNENCDSCPKDCGACPGSEHCGNSICETALSENYADCPQDCRTAAPAGSDFIVPAIVLAAIILALVIYRRRKSKAEVVYKRPF
jgi:putative hemolysin